MNTSEQNQADQIEDVSGYRPPAIAAGVILLGVGIAMLLDSTGTVDIHFGRLIGPFVLITIGASMTLGRSPLIVGYRGSRRDRDGRVHFPRRGRPTTGIWLIGVGVWMLVSQTGLFGLHFHNSWPLLIIFGGIIMVIRGFK